MAHDGIAERLGIVSGIAARELLILCEIKDVVVDTAEVVEVAEVDKEKDHLVWAGEEAIGLIHMSKLSKILVALMIKGVGAALPT